MENPFLVGLSRQVALRRELDVIANNVANLGTAGFKAENVSFQEFLNGAARGDDFNRPDRRPSFVVDRATWTDFAQGPFQNTGNPLDVAIEGRGFFAVETPQGERYTRAGGLQINAQGELVTAQGHRVLGEGGVIRFEPRDRDIVIARDGTISVPGAVRGRLRVVRFDNEQQLAKDGLNTFRAPATMQAQEAREARIVQGAIERSNVKPVAELARLMDVTRAYTSIQGLLDRGQDLRRRAIDELAQTPN